MQASITTGRFWPKAIILIFLAVQVLVPLSYYVGDARDDERFAWRMFSAARLRQCHISVFEKKEENITRVNLNRLLHSAWIHTLARGRDSAREAFFKKQCRTAPRAHVIFHRQCKDVFGELSVDETTERDCKALLRKSNDAFF